MIFPACVSTGQRQGGPGAIEPYAAWAVHGHPPFAAFPRALQDMPGPAALEEAPRDSRPAPRPSPLASQPDDTVRELVELELLREWQARPLARKPLRQEVLLGSTSAEPRCSDPYGEHRPARPV